MADHTAERHASNLELLCRICGKRCTRTRRKEVVYNVFQHTSGIQMAFGVCVEQDSPAIHSPNFCIRCYVKMCTIKQKGLTEKLISLNNDTLRTSQGLWVPYNNDIDIRSCPLCQQCSDLSKGGRRRKFVKNTLVVSQMCASAIQSSSSHCAILNEATGPMIDQADSITPLEYHHSNHISVSSLDKSVCLSQSDSTVTPPTTFECLDNDVDKLDDSICNLSAPASSVPPQSHVDISNLSPILCHKSVSRHNSPIQQNLSTNAQDMNSNQQSYLLSDVYPSTSSTMQQCSQRQTINSIPPMQSTPKKSNAKSSMPHKRNAINFGTPLTPREEAKFTSLLKRKLYHSKNGKIIKAKTGGPPILLSRIVGVRKRSGIASSPLKKRRAREIRKIVQQVAGNESDDEERQCIRILKSFSKRKRERVCSAAGIKNRAEFDALYGMAYKYYTGLSWSQWRKTKRILSKLGVKCAHEMKERKNIEHIFPKLEEVKLEGSDIFTVVNVQDLGLFLSDLLDRYSAGNFLTWHNGAIPDDEVWVKIGGDYGRKSFKLAFEILNLHSPNSPENTYPVLLAFVKDTAKNLVAILQHYRKQIEDIQISYWNGKKVRLFLFGDYDFLSKVYGHQGACCFHPCLWCLVTKEDVQTRSGITRHSRTLENIQSDFQTYTDKGQGRLLRAKHYNYNNIIREPLLNIPLDHVVPPYLHILLGVIKKHHDIIQYVYNDIDKWIASESVHYTMTLPAVSVEFDKYTKGLNDLMDKMIDTETSINCRMSMGKDCSRLEEQWAELEDDFQKALKSFPDFQGPLCTALHATLETHGIVRQAYHSNSFVGNHCHKYLQEDFLDSLSKSMLEKVLEVTSKPNIIAKTMGVTQQYKSVLVKYSSIHRLMSHKNPVKDEDIQFLKSVIDEYLRMFHKMYPHANLIPKQHFLEFHCIPFMQRFGFGMGFHGEQGGEQLHARLNRINRASKGMRRLGERMMYIMKTAIAMNSPELRMMIPPIQRRKSKSM